MKRLTERRALETVETLMGTISARRCRVLTSELSALCEAIEAFTQDQQPAKLSRSEATRPVGDTWALLERLT